MQKFAFASYRPSFVNRTHCLSCTDYRVQLELCILPLLDENCCDYTLDLLPILLFGVQLIMLHSRMQSQVSNFNGCFPICP